MHFVGCVPVTAEDIISANVNHLSSNFAASLRYPTRPKTINLDSVFRFRLRLINRRISRAMNDRLRFLLQDKILRARLGRQANLIACGAYDLNAAPLQFLHNVEAKLPRDTRY